MPIEIYNEGYRRLEMLAQASRSKMASIADENNLDDSVKQNRLEKGFASIMAVETMKDLLSKVGENLSTLDMEILLSKESLQKTAKDIYDSAAFETITKRLSNDDYLGIASDESDKAATKAYQTLHEAARKIPGKRTEVLEPVAPKQMIK